MYNERVPKVNHLRPLFHYLIRRYLICEFSLIREVIKKSVLLVHLQNHLHIVECTLEEEVLDNQWQQLPHNLGIVCFSKYYSLIALARTPSSGGSLPSLYKEKFEEIQLIGRGSFGEVYKVLDKEKQKYFAVKKLKKLNDR